MRPRVEARYLFKARKAVVSPLDKVLFLIYCNGNSTDNRLYNKLQPHTHTAMTRTQSCRTVTFSICNGVSTYYKQVHETVNKCSSAVHVTPGNEKIGLSIICGWCQNNSFSCWAFRGQRTQSSRVIGQEHEASGGFRIGQGRYDQKIISH